MSSLIEYNTLSNKEIEKSAASEDELRHWQYYLGNFNNDICINTVSFTKTPSKNVLNNHGYIVLNFENINIQRN